MKMLPSTVKLSLYIVIFLANLISQPVYGLRILGLFPFQTKSHFSPGEVLMRGLAEKGHQIDVYSHFPLVKPIPNYTDFSLEGTLPHSKNNITYEHFLAFTTSAIDVLLNRARSSIANVCRLLEHPHFQKLLHNPPRDPPYDLVILEFSLTDCFAYWGWYLNVPIIAIVSLPTMDTLDGPMANPINLAVHSSLLSRYAWPMTFTERISNTITYYTTLAMNYIFIRENMEYLRKIFGPDIPSMPCIMKDFSLVLTNQNVAINAIKPYNPSMVPIAGLHIVDHVETLPKDIREWLDNSKHGCVYFSFGSMVRIETFPGDKIRAFFEAFRDIAPIRVLMKIVKPEELPNDIPSNVMVKPWFPQIQVLKHKNVKAFVTHGGLMSTQESIYFAVPMLGIPLFSDQFFNIDSYVKRKIAIRLYLEEINKETFSKALNEVLNNPIYRRSIEKVSRKFKDLPMSPKDTAIFWIEYISRHGKDALKSPLVDMPAYQSMLLDVYGFFALIVILLLYSIVKLFRKFFKICSYEFWNGTIPKTKNS